MPGRVAAVLLVSSWLCLPASLLAQEPARPDSQATPADIRRLEQRIEELERSKLAQEEATRAIIRQSLERSSSNINNVVSFGGVLEVLAGHGWNFERVADRALRLDALECRFDVQMNDWSLSQFVLQYDDGTDIAFSTAEGGQAGVPRIDVDTAILTLGDTQKLSPFGTLGRMILPFGISTGDPVADIPTLEAPLTVEAFEMLEDGVVLGLSLPTPIPTPSMPIKAPTPIRPRIIAPFISKVGRDMGYRPPMQPPEEPNLVLPTPPPPPFTAGLVFFKGHTVDPKRPGWSPGQHVGATVGYRTSGPTAFDVNLDYNSSVFDSRFLEREYEAYFDQIGLIRGMAASLKAKCRGLGVVGEWNGAVETARFTDDAGRKVEIKPEAWQAGVVYQLGWNSTVESLAAQGTYLSFGYSRSHGLGGATRVIEAAPTRIGALPQERILVGIGEWVLNGMRLQVEYSRMRDYSVRQGGTGRRVNGVFTKLTYEW